MLVYFDTETQAKLQGLGRHHPWSVGESSPDYRYVDFKEHPELIVETLEDLKPVSGTSAEQTVIDFLSWANGSQSKFETNDFGMGPIKNNESRTSPSKLEIQGRVTLLFRDLALNTQEAKVAALLQVVEKNLRVSDPEFKQACWSWSRWPHLFTDLLEIGEPAEGQCCAFQFWAWGDDQEEVNDNLDRAFRNLRSALEAAVNTIDRPPS